MYIMSVHCPQLHTRYEYHHRDCCRDHKSDFLVFWVLEEHNFIFIVIIPLQFSLFFIFLSFRFVFFYLFLFFSVSFSICFFFFILNSFFLFESLVISLFLLHKVDIALYNKQDMTLGYPVIQIGSLECTKN